MQTDKPGTAANLPPDALRALRLACGHLNVSTQAKIDPHELLSVLTGRSAAKLSDGRLHAFFDEIEPETLTDLVLSGVITYRQLAKGAGIHLERTHENWTWLDERKTF